MHEPCRQEWNSPVTNSHLALNRLDTRRHDDKASHV
jgi:hypothetical protein